MNKTVWIWGVSVSGKLVHRIISENSIYRIVGFIDKSPIYYNQSYKGTPICTYESAKPIISPDDEIIICTRKSNYEEISNKLRDDGFENYRWVYEFLSENNTNSLIQNEMRTNGTSKLCDSNDFRDNTIKKYFQIIWGIPLAVMKPMEYHRKLWEWCYIAKCLEVEGLLKQGRKGIGFAVGKEPLPSLFASMNVEVMATDLGGDTEVGKKWAVNNQNAEGNIEGLLYDEICNKNAFASNVKYRDVDMNNIPDDLKCGYYDFCWSSCAIEHVGSLEKSKNFMRQMIKCIKKGGLAVHTTEFNLSSETETIESGWNVIWRKKDIYQMQRELKELGCSMDISFYRAETEQNQYVDLPPYEGEGKPYHLNLAIDDFISTSFAFVIRKEG